MRRFLSLLSIAAVLGLAAPALADDYLETVSTSTTSAKTARGYGDGKWYSVQCTTAARYRTCADSTCTAVATDELIPASPTVFDIYLPVGRSWFAFILDAGSGSCFLYRALWQQRT